MSDEKHNSMDIMINITQRPWGFYIKLFQESGVWVKRVEVNPGARLSLQKHEYRSEKWNIVSGNGKVTLNDREIPVGPGSIVDVPVGAVHRMTNDGSEKLIFIEVACGEQLSEEDIIRLEDDYNRSK